MDGVVLRQVPGAEHAGAVLLHGGDDVLAGVADERTLLYDRGADRPGLQNEERRALVTGGHGDRLRGEDGGVVPQLPVVDRQRPAVVVEHPVRGGVGTG
ncbi:hypothetical protein BFG51_12185 [Dietzia alimentaria]|nr:hypothetical protein BFG51_12185 [Dietzia alimentaria]